MHLYIATHHTHEHTPPLNDINITGTSISLAALNGTQYRHLFCLSGGKKGKRGLKVDLLCKYLHFCCASTFTFLPKKKKKALPSFVKFITPMHFVALQHYSLTLSLSN
jgi:hypothetical protein